MCQLKIIYDLNFMMSWMKTHLTFDEMSGNWLLQLGIHMRIENAKEDYVMKPWSWVRGV